MYMSKFVGEKFNAIISSVTSFGIFVKLENTVEGHVCVCTEGPVFNTRKLKWQI